MAGVTLREIARQSGVSYQTVSRILNQQSDLHKPDTVARVQKVAKELGYRPNLNARGIQTGKTRMIGIINSFDRDSFGVNMLMGLHDVLIRLDYLPIMLMTSPGLCSEMDQAHRLVDRRVEGILMRLEPDESAHPCLLEILERNIPLVTIDVEPPRSVYVDFVGTDELEAGRLAAKHLLELGHAHVAYMSWLMDTPKKQRLAQGFQEVFLPAGETNLKIIDVPFDPQTCGESYAHDLLSQSDRPTAIFAGTDDLAKGIYAAAKDLNLRIPQDLSVIGFSDLEFASQMTPPLTTIRQNPAQIGAKAVQLLLQRVNGGFTDPRPRKIQFAPDFIERQSTAPQVC